MTNNIENNRMITGELSAQTADLTPRVYTADEVATLLSVSKSTAYREIRKLNEELSAKGFMTLPGRISRRFFDEKSYR